MAIHYSLAAIILTGSMASTGIAATTWTSAPPRSLPHSPLPLLRVAILTWENKVKAYHDQHAAFPANGCRSSSNIH